MSSPITTAMKQPSMRRQRQLHVQQFLLFDYRLNVIKRILIYVLITTRFFVEANDFDKSETTTNTNRKTTTTTTTRTTTRNQTRITASTVFSALILLLNRTSSAIFLSDDTAPAPAVDAAVVTTKAAVVDATTTMPSTITETTTTTTMSLPTINEFDASNFGIETIKHTNQNAKEFRKRNKRNTRDDLLDMTTVENTNATSTATTTTMQQTTMATTAKLSAKLKVLTTPPPSSASPSSSSASSTTTNATSMRILSRSKRFLTFPEGSSFSVAVCFTVGIIGNPRFDYMAFGLNWGVAYDLPNSTWVINHLHGYSRQPVPVTVLRRRTRRALYKEIELVVDNMGYNGRDCVLRALCESRQYFSKNKLSMIGEMMRVVFSLPKQRIFTRELHENSEIEVYDRAYRRARDASCDKQYDCTFSLLELAFGKYSTPPKGYYE